MRKKIHCLLIEDESAIRDMIRFAIEDLQLTEANDTPQAEILLAKNAPDIIVLDWMLPTKSGIEFIGWLKKYDIYRDIPIIMLTAKAEEHNKIRGLEVGADDYMTKPFSPKELYTRIKTILRRGRLQSGKICIGRLIIDTDATMALVDNQPIPLTTNEYKLLEWLAKHLNKTFTREQLINRVWGSVSDIDERTVDSQIKRLRKQLKRYCHLDIIKTIRGIGYQCISPDHE